MEKVTLVVRLLLGLIFFVFGLNGFFLFFPMPPMEGVPAVFFQGLMATKYFLPVLSGTEVLCGALLLVGAYVPLALIMLAPVIVHIVLYHVFVDTAGLIMALVIGAFEVYLAFFSKAYSPIVKQIFRCPMREAMKAKAK